jgi:hypothetical protein
MTIEVGRRTRATAEERPKALPVGTPLFCLLRSDSNGTVVRHLGHQMLCLRHAWNHNMLC